MPDHVARGWKDATSYRQGVPKDERVPTIWGRTLGPKGSRLRIRVHRLLGLNDRWFLSVPELSIKDVDLYKRDIESATTEAEVFVARHLEHLRGLLGSVGTIRAYADELRILVDRTPKTHKLYCMDAELLLVPCELLVNGPDGLPLDLHDIPEIQADGVMVNAGRISGDCGGW